MSAVQYPFIDIAVHERVRDQFAAGEAVVLFSPDMKNALWANGRGADLFGYGSIYDFLDQGPVPGDVAFRQVAATARQLATVGDSRSFTIRITSGFQRIPVQATCELIQVSGKSAILLTAPVSQGKLSEAERAARMIEGLDDPDTYMAVLDANGAVLAASADFETLNVTVQTAKMLVTMASSDPSRLVKRLIPTTKGYLPTAIGKLSDAPALHLLFTVETAQNRADPGTSYEPRREPAAVVPEAALPAAATEEVAVVEEPAVVEEIAAIEPPATPAQPESDAFADVITAVSQIEESEEPEEEISLETGDLPEPLEVPEAIEHVEGAVTETEVESETVAGTIDDIEETPPLSEEASEEVEPESGPADEVVEEESVVADELAATAAEKSDDGFVFRRDARATRFVWKIDAEGRFSEVSGEFANAVGPHAADINGMAFTDLASLFNLDPEGKIADLLSKRDTWSGKTIWWPVEGTSLIVPVDLAALPTYTRTREFDGFRGFGIVRIGDVAEDPNAIGLTLTQTTTEDQIEDLVEETGERPDDEPEIVDEAVAEDANEQHGDALPGDLSPNDWPAGERPALRLVENPGRRHSDKVIRLEERRASHKDGLSPGEQAAFREIAKQLDGFVGKPDDEVKAAAEAENDSVTTAEDVAEAPVVEDIQEPVVIEDGQDPHSLLAREEFPEIEPETVEQADGPEIEAVSEADESDVDEADVEPETEAELDAELEENPEVISEETVNDPEPEAEQVAEADEPTASDSEEVEDDEGLPSEQELLSQMLPVRERIGLSAEILDQMPVALLVHSGDTLIHGNPEFLRLTGYASLQALDDVGGLDALLQRQDLEGKTAEAGGMVVVRADDALVPVTARLQSVRWGQSTALMLALMPVMSETETVATDGSDDSKVVPLRPADQLVKLQIEAEELRAILETATDGVVIIGAEGDIRSMNRAASALFNYDNEETGGKPFVMLFAHESQRSILDYLSGLSGHGVASVLNDGREVIGREASGGFLPLFMTIGKLTSSNGYCAVIRDITQWKRTEDELRTAKRAAETANAHKSDFLAHVSHEIRTPLNAIIGFADMMATERFGPIGHPRYVEYANDIGRSGRHVLDIVNDLLDISKIEAGEMELDFVAVGLNEAVSEAVSLVQPQANGQRVIIRTALSHSVPQVVADVRSIKQIVLNILSNAIRFTPSGGQIVVSTAYEANGSVMLRVRDTGIGMTRSELELAMKPFRQVAGNARKRGDGTGLGLPLTKAMVDANRAAFAISSAPNEGTLVEITFPSQRVLAN